MTGKTSVRRKRQAGGLIMISLEDCMAYLSECQALAAEAKLSLRRATAVMQLSMPRTGWTPSLAPKGDDPTVYLVVDDFGRNERIFREADI